MEKPQKRIVIFDLDETLIHATKERLSGKEDFCFQGYYIYKRPKVDDFLNECSKLCSIAIWSSAEDDYVKSVSQKLLSKNIYFDFIWGRSECWMKIVKKEDQETGLNNKEYQFIKPLEKVRRKGYKMSNLLIVDDSTYKVKDNPKNYFIINPFLGNTDDEELETLLDFIKKKISEGDFR